MPTPLPSPAAQSAETSGTGRPAVEAETRIDELVARFRRLELLAIAESSSRFRRLELLAIAERHRDWIEFQELLQIHYPRGGVR